MTAPRLAVLCDFHEEGWPSMDRVADSLVESLAAHHANAARVTRIEPPFRRRFSRARRGSKLLFNADRVINRLWEYPRALRPMQSDFDLFHIADHSYASLAHGLPAGRIGVFCHDLDTFKPLLEPQPGQPRWQRLLARHALRGMQRASVVFYSTEAVRVNIERHGLVPPERLVQALYGVSPVFAPGAAEPVPAPDYWARVAANRFLLHVGSCIPRKRIDVLLEVFAAARACEPGLLLVQIGGTWSKDHEEQIRRLGLGAHVLQLRGLDNAVLAALYARAAASLLTSEAEGFGLPIIEALACGAKVVASDLPVTREVGGDAVVYCPVADVPAWSAALFRLLREPNFGPPENTRLERAARYTWKRHAGIIASSYLALAAAARAG
jgi:glycosyltransferase involved in cell wall biosynthesis